MGSKFTPTKDDIETIKEMHRQNIPFSTIAKHFGCAGTTMKELLCVLGLNPNQWKISKCEKLDNLYFEGYDFHEIANIMGMCVTTISNYFNHTKVKTKKEWQEFHEKEQRELNKCDCYSCNARKNCKDIYKPQNCIVWRMQHKERIKND